MLRFTKLNSKVPQQFLILAFVLMKYVLNSSKLNQMKSFTFQSYGVVIEVIATESKHIDMILPRLVLALPKNFEIIEKQDVEHRYLIDSSNAEILRLYLNDIEVTAGKSEKNFFNFFESQIRLRVAEYADSKVFLHAGVVAWKGKAIVIPASSFQGKTTLVKDLIKRGATYYSDEFAVIDVDGFVHPFPKTLSVREIEGDATQVEHSAESFGGKVAKTPCPVGMVLITEYEKDAIWNPVAISAGEAVFEILPHTLPIRLNPRFALYVLNKVVSRAIICKSVRGEVEKFSTKILDYFETNI